MASQPPQPAPARSDEPSLGQLIARYRRGRRQPHRDAPWSQEELAFACWTDQAHISRIESGRQVPSYSTLDRICDALALGPLDRAALMALAGYQVAGPLPDARAVEAVLGRLAPLADSYPYPAVILDEAERMWYVNPIVARVWGPCYGATDQRGCIDLVRGRRVVELMFDPDPARARLAAWRVFYDDFERVVGRILTVFARVCAARPADPELRAILSQLTLDPEFRSRWAALDLDGDEHLLLDHYPYVITPPTLGPLRFHCWRTRVATDERLLVVHFTPTDRHTSEVMARLSDA